MNEKIKDEYYLLTEKLDEINLSLKGDCNDIDCDKYMYKGLLKKRYKPVLEHNFSCKNKLRKEKEAVMRLLSQRKFGKLRFEKCVVCKKMLYKLSDKNTIVSFTRPTKDKKYHEWEGVRVHNSCSKKVKIPNGWEKFR